jgi:hypothetical protein
MKIKGYNSETQKKNIAWFLPRPKPDHYKGGMPLYCEDWLIELGHELLFDTGYYSLEKENYKEQPKILNLFCGMNKHGFRIDIKDEVKPDLLCDAHSFSDKIGDRKFNLIIADPPYSTQEAKEIYQTKPLKYKTWSAECEKVLEDKGLLVVYHKYVMPNPNPDVFSVIKRVFIGNRTYHLPRCAIFFAKGL